MFTDWVQSPTSERTVEVLIILLPRILHLSSNAFPINVFPLPFGPTRMYTVLTLDLFTFNSFCRTAAISGSRKRLSKIDRLVRESAALLSSAIFARASRSEKGTRSTIQSGAHTGIGEWRFPFSHECTHQPHDYKTDHEYWDAEEERPQHEHLQEVRKHFRRQRGKTFSPSRGVHQQLNRNSAGVNHEKARRDASRPPQCLFPLISRAHWIFLFGLAERWRSAARDLTRTTPPNSFASPLHCLVRKRGQSRLYMQSGKSRSTAAMTRHLFVTYAWALRDSIAVTI